MTELLATCADVVPLPEAAIVWLFSAAGGFLTARFVYHGRFRP